MRLAAAAAAFVGGAGLALAGGFGGDIPGPAVALFIAALAMALLALRLGGRPTFWLLLAGFFLAGAAVAHADAAGRVGDRLDLDAFGPPGSTAVMTGWLTEDARPAPSGVRLTLRVEPAGGTGDSADTAFDVTVYTSRLIDSTGSGRSTTGFRYGDRYEFTGPVRLGEPFPGAGTLGTVPASSVMLIASDAGNPVRRWLAGLRERLSGSASAVLSQPASGLTSAMLVGDRNGLDPREIFAFRASGTAHVLAISGLHIALTGGAAMIAAAAVFGRRRQMYLLAPATVTWGYAALAGFSPSVTRAAIMFSVFLLGRALGRQNAVLPALGFAAAVMVAFEPQIILSASFQLSFAAVAGIAILSPRIWSALSSRFTVLADRGHRGAGLIRPLAATVVVSLAASVATWPLIAVTFGAAPVWGVVATPLILPAMPLLVLGGALTATVGLISTSVAEPLGWPVWVISRYVSGVAHMFAGAPPGAIETTGWGAGALVVYYALLAGAVWWKRVTAAVRRAYLWPAARPGAGRGFRMQGRKAPAWAVVLAVVIAATAWSGAATAGGTGELTVTFFETDRGDMVLVRTPNGNTMLIDGGRNARGAVSALDAELPFWDRSVDLVLLTHPDADHVGGLLAVLERYDVGNVAHAVAVHDSDVYRAWQDALESRDDVYEVVPGTVIGLDDGVSLEVLSAGRPFPGASLNDASIVMMLRYREFSMLLPGDITKLTERSLVASGRDLRATVLKAPHHGSATSSSDEFLQAVAPVVAVFQVGVDNRFGHPADEVVERVRSYVPDGNIFVTSKQGAVTVRTDGEKVWVETTK